MSGQCDLAHAVARHRRTTYPADARALSVVRLLCGGPETDDVWTACGRACRRTVNNAAASGGTGWNARSREKVVRGTAEMRW